MNWTAYGSFLAFAIVLILIPGPDFAVVTKNTLAGGRYRGSWTAIGVTSSNVVQGSVAVAGLGAVIVRVQPLFEAIKWAGVGYLIYLGGQALRSALRGEYEPLEGAPGNGGGAAFRGWRQGFLSNITNPKVLVFYLAVLPQFLAPSTGIGMLLIFALSHAALGLLYSFAVVGFMHGARLVLSRRRVRRGLDAFTGVVLLGFSARLATEQA
jgi:threonine/homoserine/homoserine lactone efflux protein